MAQGREPHQIRPPATRIHYRLELFDKGNRSPEQTKVLECPLMAEGVEEVAEVRIFETMFQSPGRC